MTPVLTQQKEKSCSQASKTWRAFQKFTIPYSKNTSEAGSCFRCDARARESPLQGGRKPPGDRLLCALESGPSGP